MTEEEACLARWRSDPDLSCFLPAGHDGEHNYKSAKARRRGTMTERTKHPCCGRWLSGPHRPDCTNYQPVVWGGGSFGGLERSPEEKTPPASEAVCSLKEMLDDDEWWAGKLRYGAAAVPLIRSAIRNAMFPDPDVYIAIRDATIKAVSEFTDPPASEAVGVLEDLLADASAGRINIAMAHAATVALEAVKGELANPRYLQMCIVHKDEFRSKEFTWDWRCPACMKNAITAAQAEIDRLRQRVAELEKRGEGEA